MTHATLAWLPEAVNDFGMFSESAQYWCWLQITAVMHYPALIVA
jgi:hypothetical protein